MGAESTKCAWCRQQGQAGMEPITSTDENAVVADGPYKTTSSMTVDTEVGEMPRTPRFASRGRSKSCRFKSQEGDPIYYSFRVSEIVNQRIEQHIAEALQLVRSSRYTDAELRGHICRVAALAWHDRDGDVYHLRQQCRELGDELVKAHCDEDIDVQEANRLLLVSSSTPESEVFCKAVKKPQWILNYDCETQDIDDIKEAIEAKSRELKPRTVAFVNHGLDDNGYWNIAKNCSVHVAGETKPNLSDSMTTFFKALGAAAECRVDFLACDLACEPSGLALIQELEGIMGKSIAASTNPTGNMRHGGDWIMETKHVDTAAIYFDTERLQKWDGMLQSHYTAQVRESEATRERWRGPFHYSDSEDQDDGTLTENARRVQALEEFQAYQSRISSAERHYMERAQKDKEIVEIREQLRSKGHTRKKKPPKGRHKGSRDQEIYLKSQEVAPSLGT
eukprot:gnl/TRDRNA2_/TRDRNA2_80811_c0_seq1.p1 gnl/TRDRNA2_/TRDRNA2_80811_c0~~gnl/TRDRNA2_/TRDRNA2_80811_c0_seq1.p1  ORF type:complete len:450 (-),score=56.22 gnl/TRDRNA2_/TRDRNA2_80811_c0_seq1:25-1374(-)